MATVPAASPSNPLDYFFLYSYPIAFLGAIFFSVNSFMNLKPISSFANGHVEMALNGYIAIAGFFSLLLWLQPWNLGAISTFLNGVTSALQPVYNVNTIKTSSSS
jgi:hypothetical protein